jgi:acyl-CoA dehydrogenase
VSVLAYLIATARRYGWPRPAIARACAVLASLATLSPADPSSPAVHVALAGAIDLARAIVNDLEPCWQNTPEEERARWQRDRSLLDIAGKARALRLEKAWSSL